MTVCWKLTLLTAAPDAGEAALEAAGASATATVPDIDDDSGLYKDTVGRSQHKIEAYYDFEPDVTGMALAAGDTFTLEALPDIDWVSEGQKNLKPVHVPPFHLYGSHDRQHKQRAHRGAGHAIEMNAGMAFGSGHHGTTQGCLALLAQHSKRARPRHVADIGCGSGTLAIANLAPDRSLPAITTPMRCVSPVTTPNKTVSPPLSRPCSPSAWPTKRCARVPLMM
jgi:ribosomal protein L11 methyltransferase